MSQWIQGGIKGFTGEGGALGPAPDDGTDSLAYALFEVVNVEAAFLEEVASHRCNSACGRWTEA